MRFVLTVLSGLLLLISACDREQIPDVPSHKNYTIDVPAGWSDYYHASDNGFSASAPREGPDDLIVENLVITTAPLGRGRGLPEYLNVARRTLEKELDAPVSSPVEARVGPYAGSGMTSVFHDRGRNVQVDMYYVTDSRYVFQIMTSALQGDSGSQRIFEQAIASFRIVP